MLIDCHSHLSFMEDSALKKVMQVESKTWVLGGYNPNDWNKQKELKEKYPHQVQTCFGLHPWYVVSPEFSFKKDLLSFEEQYQKADWVGEVGLDFFIKQTSKQKDQQLKVFLAQLKIAQEKPFVFHIVKAHDKALQILKEIKVKGFVHSFSGSTQVASAYFKQGVLLSFGPNLLNKNFKKTRESLAALPLEAILIESDTPRSLDDLSNPNEIYIKVLEEVAKIKKIDKKDLIIQINKNIKTLLA